MMRSLTGASAGFCPCAHVACVALADRKHSRAYGGGCMCAHRGKRQARAEPSAGEREGTPSHENGQRSLHPEQPVSA